MSSEYTNRREEPPEGKKYFQEKVQNKKKRYLARFGFSHEPKIIATVVQQKSERLTITITDCGLAIKIIDCLNQFDEQNLSSFKRRQTIKVILGTMRVCEWINERIRHIVKWRTEERRRREKCFDIPFAFSLLRMRTRSGVALRINLKYTYSMLTLISRSMFCL